MNRRRLLWVVAVLAIASAGLALWLVVSAAGLAGVDGVVVGPDGALARARVRVRATSNLTFTDPIGRFILTGLTAGQQIEVSAWYTGHYISSTHVTPTVSGLTLRLRPYHTSDHPSYQWTSPITGTSAGACGNCHPMIISQWANNAHGQAVSNPRFFSLYDGANLSGTAVISPGYRLDFPGTAGNCANCHAPAAGVDGYLTTAMSDVRGVITAGVLCDFCHKVGGVYLDPATGSVYPNAPGVQSQRVLRPPPGDNIFFGPFDDIPDPDTYLPLISKSQYCAPCHQFSFWGTPIYESYEEWLSSPYASQGVTCQQCHMPPTGDRYFALPSAGGLAHPPEQIPSHLQLGATSPELLRETVTMTLRVQQSANQAQATVQITNTGAGHHVPTDHPGRHLILNVSAVDSLGRPLTQLSGPTIPGWGGAEAGLPGQAYAKVLQDAISGQFPVVSYWRQTFIASDNRIPALASDVSSYAFSLPPGGGNVLVTARLIFRRLYQDEASQRGWVAPDFVMEERSVTLAPGPTYDLLLPVLANGAANP